MYQDGNASGTFSALESLDFLLEIQRRLWWSCQFHTLMETDKGCQLIRQPFHLLCIKNTPCFLKKPAVRNPHSKSRFARLKICFMLFTQVDFASMCNAMYTLAYPCPMTFLRLFFFSPKLTEWLNNAVYTCLWNISKSFNENGLVFTWGPCHGVKS